MAITDLYTKGIRHRGLYEGKEQSVSGRFRLRDGQSVAAGETVLAIPLGENVAPYRVMLTATKLDGTPTLTGAAFDVGVAPFKDEDVERADGRVYPPLEEDLDRFGSLDVTSAARDAADVTVDPADDAKWGPFYVTLTADAEASVADGDVDIQLTVYFLGEKEEADPVYSEWLVNGGKFQND